MKNFIISFLTAIFCLLACAVNAQEQATWDYPVKPGTEEWNRIQTEPERIAAVQIPEEILEKLSSDDIVRLCITFPLFSDFTYFNTPQEGFEVMVARFNLFARLLEKKDTGRRLIDAYKDTDMKGFKTLPYSCEFWTIKLNYLELLLTQRSILQSLMSGEKLELLKEARKKFSEKMDSNSFSSFYGVLSTVRIMAGILDMEAYQEWLLSPNRQKADRFLQTGRLGDVSLIEEIVRMTDNYLNNKNQIP